MTAEIAIINRHAIALAADSAVTVGKDKVWKTANKLFSLGPHHDIAIMVYGSGDFLGLSWETIVKEFRRSAVKKQFKLVSECAAAFKSFLGSSHMFGRDDQQIYSVMFPVLDILSGVEPKSLESVKGDLRQIIDALKGGDTCITDVDEIEYNSYVSDFLEQFCNDRFGEHITTNIMNDVKVIAFLFFVGKRPSLYHSGVVVAGFGIDEYHPSLSHHIVDGKWGDKVRWWDGENCKNLNTKDHHDLYPIVPFAQDDMSFQFMTGIANDYLDFLREGLGRVMSPAFDQLIDEFVPKGRAGAAKIKMKATAEALVSSVMESLYKKVKEEQYEPVNRAVSALPKEEMAMMAEALVDLTSLKRKVDSRLESVGGPVDVAVISKGDGFVWIKRKYYFDPQKNMEFFARKQMREMEVRDE